jgi:hypothetical protein
LQPTAKAGNSEAGNTQPAETFDESLPTQDDCIDTFGADGEKPVNDKLIRLNIL